MHGKLKGNHVLYEINGKLCLFGEYIKLFTDGFCFDDVFYVAKSQKGGTLATQVCKLLTYMINKYAVHTEENILTRNT